jgi:hypothetical protein
VGDECPESDTGGIDPVVAHHSLLRTRAGSTRVARRAGSQVAKAEIPSTRIAVPDSDNGCAVRRSGAVRGAAPLHAGAGLSVGLEDLPVSGDEEGLRWVDSLVSSLV